MSVCFCHPNRWPRFWLLASAVVGAAMVLSTGLRAETQTEPPIETPIRLLDREPFDRVTLNAANGGEAIDTLLLDLPNRRVPDPLPTSGQLELRRIDQPSIAYLVSWASLAKVELYEQMLLAEAKRLTATDHLPEAFEYLDFLQRYYPHLPGLSKAIEQHLTRDASTAFAAGRNEEALTIVLSLYEINPDRPGLARVVESITDRMISKYFAEKNYAASRNALKMLATTFPKLRLSNLAKWESKLSKTTALLTASAQQAIAAKRFADAQRFLRRARAVFPDDPEVVRLSEVLNRVAPQIVVGVTQQGPSITMQRPYDWPSQRVARLIAPQLVELNDFGSEGGIYTSRWAKLTRNDTGLRLILHLNDLASHAGIAADQVSRQLLRSAIPTSPTYRENMASLLRQVGLREGHQVEITWQHNHVRPESLLQLPINLLTNAAAYRQITDEETSLRIEYLRSNDNSTGLGQARMQARMIVEERIENETAALTALVNARVDVLDRISPWQVEPMRQVDGVVVQRYRLPTVHVLFPNYANPLLQRREFRRALCYGIDREQILRDLVLGGRTQAGFRVLSAPLLAGINPSDGIGYGYKQELRPRPYEPRLAAVLASVARKALKKSNHNEKDEKENSAVVPIEPLILAHPSDPLAQAVCQAIKLQLDALGIRIDLLPLSASSAESSKPYDLLYAELTMNEPIVDARYLLGPRGRAGNCSAAMNLALRDVDRAQNWNDARKRLHRVHEVAFSDLQVIPLWQTVNYFARRDSLQGIGNSPVSLYQNVDAWNISTTRTSR